MIGPFDFGKVTLIAVMVLRKYFAAFAILIAVAAPIATVHPASAADTTFEYAGDLARVCDSHNATDLELCEGFIGATLEIAANNQVYGLKICMPARTNLDSAVELTRRWLHEHPQDQTRPASLVVVMALRSSFGCK